MKKNGAFPHWDAPSVGSSRSTQSRGLVFGRPLMTFWPGFQRPSALSRLTRSNFFRTFLFMRILPEVFKLGCLDMVHSPFYVLSLCKMLLSTQRRKNIPSSREISSRVSRKYRKSFFSTGRPSISLTLPGVRMFRREKESSVPAKCLSRLDKNRTWSIFIKIL